MKKGLLIIVLSVCWSCSTNPETFIPHIEGYWEIEEVTLHDGNKRSYGYNNTVDYIEITDSLNGFRKKLKPNLYGQFETSNSSESFQIKIENDSLNLYYQTPFSTWKETVLDASAEHLRVINNTNKDVYLYKRYEPLNLE
ncbi:MAG: hypothetical protein GYB32_07410 [Algicola sp.]|nr:hypothetical protein [Algicola sp.]